MITERETIDILGYLANRVSEHELRGFYGDRYRFRPQGSYTLVASLRDTRPVMLTPVFLVLRGRYNNLPAERVIEDDNEADAFGRALAAVVTPAELAAALNALDRLRYERTRTGGDAEKRGNWYGVR